MPHMIFVAGTLTIDPAHVDQFSADLKAMRPRVLEEDGCLHYSLLIEDRSAGIVNVLEMWSSEDALKVHFTMPWVIDFATKFSPHMQASTVQIYEIANTRPLPAM